MASRAHANKLLFTTTMIFLSKNGTDEYINMFAKSVGVLPVSDFDYEVSSEPIVLRGILKHKIIKRCWADGRDFYYIDTGYFGNKLTKLYHRIVKNNLQHGDIVPRPDDRWKKLNIQIQPWRAPGRKILIAAPDEKPCIFYNIKLNANTFKVSLK